jgi:hypothetical protein
MIEKEAEAGQDPAIVTGGDAGILVKLGQQQ